MNRIRRKDIKHDEFVDTSFKLLHVIEEHPKTLLSIVAGLLGLVIVVTGVWSYLEHEKMKAADAFSRAQAAQMGVIARDGSPNPTAPYRPTFKDAAQRQQVALERLGKVAEGSGMAAQLAGYLEGVTLLEAGETDAAVARLEESVATLGEDPTLGGGVKEAFARALEQKGRLERALAIWKELIAEGSNYPRDLGLLGQARVETALGRAETAREAYQEIIDLFPQSPVAAKAREALDKS